MMCRFDNKKRFPAKFITPLLLHLFLLFLEEKDKWIDIIKI